MCKKDLIEIIYNFTDAELIDEILKGAPRQWRTIINPSTVPDLLQFMFEVKE